MQPTSASSASSFVVGLGANLGQREVTLERAYHRLAGEVQLAARSRLYETAAMGPPQPNYLNAAVLLRSAMDPEQLLDVLLAIERELGRVRRARWGPRSIDLDLLWGDGLRFQSQRLTLPHRGLLLRPFALVPLVEVAPRATDPSTGESYARLAAALGQAGILDARPWVVSP